MSSRTLVRVAEVWTPSPDGQTLALASGGYGQLHDFQRASAAARFSRGEGLPGRIWERGEATVLGRLSRDPAFSRAEIAMRFGLTAALGFPVFHGDSLVAVCVLICGDPNETAGALEVWEPEEGRDSLGLSSGYYGAHDGFRRLSALMKFPRGIGLPGQIWEEGQPVLLEDVSHAAPFIRAAAAETYGLSSGFGFPIYKENRLASVVTFLSVRDIPIARAIEVWAPDPSLRRLTLRSSSYDGVVSHGGSQTKRFLDRGEGLAGKVWDASIPCVVTSLSPKDVPADVDSKDLLMGIGIPIFDAGGCRAVVVMLN